MLHADSAAPQQQLDTEQRRLLRLLSRCADRYSFLKSVFIFGSVARGDARSDSDVDIALEYINSLFLDNKAMQSYLDFQFNVEALARALGRKVGRRISLHNAVYDFRGEDAAMSAVRAAASAPLAQIGKVSIVATPRKLLTTNN
jgi:predicted nucleotidyltransferase